MLMRGDQLAVGNVIRYREFDAIVVETWNGTPPHGFEDPCGCVIAFVDRGEPLRVRLTWANEEALEAEKVEVL